jgi:hypothetical protein
MSEGENRLKAALVTYFPMLIAVLSLMTAIFGSYTNSRFLDFAERNAGRTEYMHTCKDIIEAYFQVKLRAGALNSAGAQPQSGSAQSDRTEGMNAVSKFAALGTYLANLRDEAIRVHYTALSRELERIMREAKGMPPAEFGKAFERADLAFTEINADCVKQAKEMRM